MEALRTRDLRVVMEVAHRFGEAEGLDAFRAQALGGIARLIDGNLYGYNEVAPTGRPLVLLAPDDPPWVEPALERNADGHPLIRHIVATGDTSARAISDVMTQRELRRRRIHDEVFGPLGAADQLAVSVTQPGGLVIGLAVNRPRPGFSSRDRAVLDALQPFLAQGYGRALDWELRLEIVDALGRAGDAVRRPVVLVTPDGVVELVTSGAGALLGPLAPVPGERLPPALAAWHAARRRGEPARLSGGLAATLVAGPAHGLDAIVLAPSVARLHRAGLEGLGLTAREAQVLELVAAGCSNADAGTRLGMAPNTVAKHLSRVYRKLGVTNRTAAVAGARCLLGAEA